MSSKRSVKTPVSAKTIRTAFRDGTLNVKDVKDANGKPINPVSVLGADGDASRCRGRLLPAFAAFYTEKFPNTTYAEKSGADERTVEVPRVSAKTGRPVKPTRLPIAEVRALAGVSGKKGRLSKADLLAAAEALTKAGR